VKSVGPARFLSKDSIMKDKENILLIHLDQLRWDCLSIYGNKQIKTPYLDELAKDSLVYENHFCSYPVCTPSRYTLLSGMAVKDHKGWDNHCTLNSEIPTWPKELRSRGYNTATVGKMHFTPTYLDTGFDTMILCEQDGPGRWDDDYHQYLKDRGLVDYLDLLDQRKEFRDHADSSYWESFGTKTNNLAEENASTGWIGARALERLNKWGEKPECLMVGFVKPHHPHDPPVPWDILYDPEEMEIHPGWTDRVSERDGVLSSGYFDNTTLTVTSLKKVQAAYYGCISEIDHHIGKMVTLLKERGLFEKTMIVVTSDHGEYLGFHHLLIKGNHMYDPLMRIPLMIKFPGEVKTGRNKALSSNTDLFSLILDDFSVLDKEVGHEFVFAHSDRGRQAMVRSMGYKLLWDNSEQTGYFFDLKNDPHEEHDLSCDPEFKEEFSIHLNALNKWQKRDYSVCQTAYLNEDEKKCSSYRASDHDKREVIVDYFTKRMAETELL
jgi:arylsulfatase